MLKRLLALAAVVSVLAAPTLTRADLDLLTTLASEVTETMRNAALFVYPSFAEGFGMPVVEAMASGVPVLHSRIAALDEVAGGAGASFPPLDVEALAGALAMALQDEPWRAKARESGLARAALFSWRRCAELTRDAYREIALP